MSRYRVGRSNLIVTKPDRTVVQREVILYFDSVTDTFGVLFVGDSPLKNHAIDVLQKELRRVRDTGEPMTELPRPT